MRKCLIALIILLMLPYAVFAHPHMFIDMKTQPVFSSEGFEGVRVNWLFDMVFTGSVLMDNDIGWKESFSSGEIEIIRETSFVNLKNYGYYTFFNTDGSFSRPQTFTDFTAFMQDNRLGYEFFLPYSGDNKKATQIRIAIYDDTFFCDIAYTEEAPVRLLKPDGADIAWRLSENRDAPIFYDNTGQLVSREGAVYSGQTFPVELVLNIKKD